MLPSIILKTVKSMKRGSLAHLSNTLKVFVIYMAGFQLNQNLMSGHICRHTTIMETRAIIPKSQVLCRTGELLIKILLSGLGAEIGGYIVGLGIRKLLQMIRSPIDIPKSNA